jgi:hypothetical protein
MLEQHSMGRPVVASWLAPTSCVCAELGSIRNMHVSNAHSFPHLTIPSLLPPLPAATGLFNFGVGADGKPRSKYAAP